jgi:hypothetical protein
VRITRQHLRRIPDLLLRSLGALEIIGLNCFLMVWTGIQLVDMTEDPLVALLPILGFGSLTFLLLHYFLVSEPVQKSLP